MIGEFFNFLTNGVFGMINGLLGIFPTMPVNADQLVRLSGVELVGTVLGWVNWFLPLDIASAIIALWSVAMMTYLAIKMAIRYSNEVI